MLQLRFGAPFVGVACEEPAASHCVVRISGPALAALARYPWPGNVRGLLDDGKMSLRELRDDLERTALSLALAKAGGSPTRAARLLGEVGRGESRDPSGTLRAMMRRYGL